MLWLPVSCRSIICFSLQLQHRLRAVSLFSSVSHTREGSSRGEAASARRKKRERQPEKRKERLPAQPEPMKYVLASQHNVNNRNHWQADDGWSTVGMFVTFPKHWHSNSRAQWSIRSYLPVMVLLQFCRLVLKKGLIFQLFCERKLATNPNEYILISGCPVKQHRGRSDQCKLKLTTRLRFRFCLSTFYVTSLLFMKGTSCCVLRSCYGKV